MNSIEIKNLAKIYPGGTEALKNINFNIKSGEGVIILGHNGSGKSTFFKSIIGFEKPTSGEVWINEKLVSVDNKRELKKIRKDVGMVFQNPNLIDNLSVFQNVLFGALGRVSGFRKIISPFASDELREEAMECLDRVGLSDIAKKRADQISGGQKQRVSIARMLMQKPQVVLADEPIASLDPRAGEEVMELLWEVAKERKCTVICVLHQMEMALKYGERIIGLKKGEVVLDSKASALSREELNKLYKN